MQASVCGRSWKYGAKPSGVQAQLGFLVTGRVGAVQCKHYPKEKLNDEQLMSKSSYPMQVFGVVKAICCFWPPDSLRSRGESQRRSSTLQRRRQPDLEDNGTAFC